MLVSRYQEFVAQGFSHVPICIKRLADMDTPLSIYTKIRAHFDNSYLFESVEGGERWGRYSIVGFGGNTRFEFSGGHLCIRQHDGQVQEEACSDPFNYIRQFMQTYRVPGRCDMPELPLFTGGLVGYFGYDTIRYVEPKLGKGPLSDPIGLPDIWLMVSDQVIIFDKLEDTLNIIVFADTAKTDGLKQAQQALASVLKLVDAPAVPVTEEKSEAVSQFVSHTGQSLYQQHVEVIQDYIRAGDVMQVVPSQRMSAPFTDDALSVYRALRHINPSPYLYFMDAKTVKNNESFCIVGSSPEILARMEAGKVTVRPLAGTRPRGATPEQDAQLEAALLADQKEIAEHLMLIDLGRNDVARVSDIGSVVVTEKMKVEYYSHVMHIVSNVEGTVRADKDALDVFAATFPAGTLTGAPKFRAMQIIDELEPVKRGVYSGAVGYLSWQGEMDTAIAIRTAVIKDGQIHVQAGAGVVADSVPESEWQETLAKSRALIKAVEMSAKNLKIE